MWAKESCVSSSCATMRGDLHRRNRPDTDGQPPRLRSYCASPTAPSATGMQAHRQNPPAPDIGQTGLRKRTRPQALLQANLPQGGRRRGAAGQRRALSRKRRGSIWKRPPGKRDPALSSRHSLIPEIRIRQGNAAAAHRGHCTAENNIGISQSKDVDARRIQRSRVLT